MTPHQEYVLAVLGVSDVPSRTMLQKLVYFLARDRHEDLGYAAHYYGPYSADVQEAMAALVRAKLISEQRSEILGWAGADYEAVQYAYALTELARPIFQREVHRDIQDAAVRIITAAKAGYAFRPTALSYAAKLAHLEDVERARIEPDEAPARAAALGWRLSSEDARRAAQLLRSIE